MADKKKQDTVVETAVVSASEVNAEKLESAFTKAQLLSSKRFAGRRDILNALLKENQKYTVKAVEQMIENYMKGKVN